MFPALSQVDSAPDQCRGLLVPGLAPAQEMGEQEKGGLEQQLNPGLVPASAKPGVRPRWREPCQAGSTAPALSCFTFLLLWQITS